MFSTEQGLHLIAMTIKIFWLWRYHPQAPNSSDLNPLEHLWDVPKQIQPMETPPCTPQDSKDLQGVSSGTRYHSAAPEVLCPCIDSQNRVRSMLGFHQIFPGHPRNAQSDFGKFFRYNFGELESSWMPSALCQALRAIPNYPDLNLIKHLWDVPEQVQPIWTHCYNPQDSKDLLGVSSGARHHRTPPEVLSPCCDGSEPILINIWSFMDQNCGYIGGWVNALSLLSSFGHSWAVLALW